MKLKPTYQQLENQIAELEKQNKNLLLTSSFQNEEKGKCADKLVIANKIQRIAEQTLKESDESFKSFFENNKAIMLQIHAETKKILSANDSALEFYGYSKTELLQKTISDLNTLLPDDIDKLMKKAIKVKSNFFQFQHKLANGKIKDVEIFCSPIKLNNELSMVISVYDITERKCMEDSLLENKYRHEKSQKLGHVGNWEYSIESKLFWVSNESKRIYGLSLNSNNFSLEQTENCIPERERVHQALIDLINYDKKYDLEFEIIPADNTAKKIIHSIAELERDESNNPIRVRGVILDITDRKKIENELIKAKEKAKKSEDRFKTYINSTSDIVYTLDTEQRHTGVYGDWYKKAGLLETDFLGKTAKEIMGEGTGVDEEANEKVLKGKSIVYEWSNILGEKTFYYQTSLSPLRNKNNKIFGIIGVGRDITNQKQVEKKLRESESKFIEMSDSLEAIIWTFNGTEYTYLNKSWYDYTGQENNTDLTIELWVSTVHPEDVEKSGKIWIENFENKTEHDNFFRLRRFDGIYRDFYCHAIPIFDKNHKFKHFLGFNIDITEQKTAELALKASEHKLKIANADKDKFFSIIAHDLRSPFNAMLGFSNILDTNFDNYDIDKKKKFISIINQGLNDTFKLLENLLYWSRSQNGSIEFKPEELNIYILFDEISKLLNQSADSKSIELVCKIPENINIIADKEMLSTVIRNLVLNAIKFTHKFGNILISARMTDNNKSVEVYVKDNGVGISKEIQSNIFDIGVNTTTKGTENEKGTGLGLILCKEFIEKHNGKIWIESEMGKGSSFYFLVPIQIEN